MRTREDVVDPSSHCVQIRLGEKQKNLGITLGLTVQFSQGRCTSCRTRNKEQGKKGRAPGKYFCRHTTCWAEHLRAVRVEEEIEHEI